MKASYLGWVLLLAGQMSAQAFTNLYSFLGYPNDGASPHSDLIMSGNTLFGTAQGGGSSGRGTVFAVNTDGTGFTNLYKFTTNSSPLFSNSDGSSPYAGLVLSGNTLYGTAYSGGGSGNGTVFRINTNGTAFTNLHNFTATVFPSFANSDGASPVAGLVLSSNTLYGTAVYGGSAGRGSVFKVNTDGTGFTMVHSFTTAPEPSIINSDGAYPVGGLILVGNTLFGTADSGGSSGKGTVFAVNIDGTGFTNLHSFTALNNSTNSDGVNPEVGLVLSGNTLYGVAYQGGSLGNGAVFAVNTNGAGFTNLHSFAGFPNDGRYPYARLILSGGVLYGTTTVGGNSNNGTMFAINTDGTGFTNLYSFTGGSDGGTPYDRLLLSGKTLYGTASQGGSSGRGTVFSLSLGLISVPLFFANSSNQLVLMWTDTNFSLQSAPLVTGTYTNIPSAASPYTNSISGAQKYFRLIGN